MRGRLTTKSRGCESSEKYNKTKLKGVQFQNEHAPLKVRVFHHEDVALRLDLEMILEMVLHLLVRLRAHKM
jgi:hypothetical protein